MLWCTSISCSQLLLCVLLWHSAITLTCHKPESKQLIGDYYRQWKIYVAVITQIIQNHCLYKETAISINRFNANHSYWHACMRALTISVKNVANFVGHIKTWNFSSGKPSRFVSRSCTGVLLGVPHVNKSCYTFTEYCTFIEKRFFADATQSHIYILYKYLIHLYNSNRKTMSLPSWGYGI